LTEIVRPHHPALLEYAIRDLRDDEVAIVKATLLGALAWRPDRPLPLPPILLLAHPEVRRYHAGWGRVGDLGVVAESNGEVLGAALCRLFTEEDHGEGYVDPSTPELAIAVNKEHRARGIGGRLLAALEGRARLAGYGQLSLSVDRVNPSARLYLRAGYQVLSEDEDGYLMLKRLRSSLL
jgi:GNAT superfamily N-acetyltransferase